MSRFNKDIQEWLEQPEFAEAYHASEVELNSHLFWSNLKVESSPLQFTMAGTIASTSVPPSNYLGSEGQPAFYKFVALDKRTYKVPA